MTPDILGLWLIFCNYLKIQDETKITIIYVSIKNHHINNPSWSTHSMGLKTITDCLSPPLNPTNL